MKYFLSIVSIVFSLQLFAQFEPKSPVKDPQTFNDKSYNFFLSKRLKTTMNQRDSLHQLVVAFNKDTTLRGKEYRYLDSLYKALTAKYNNCTEKNNELKQQFAEMNAKYNELMTKSLSDAERFNNALKIKAEELEAREKRLAELQGIINKQDSLLNALNDAVKKALLAFKSDEITVEMKNGKVYVSMSDKLLFKSGSAAVEDKGLDAIKTLGDVLNKNPDIDVLIEGHTDNIPINTAKYEDNWALSADRALSIVRLLSNQHNVNPKRLEAAGRAEFYPKASNETAEGRAKNRRTEIILSPKLDELYKLIEKNRR
ncbi:MAG: OmpA family protein [Bacteroidia bacterium]|jgi:chemotaxis protein MotB|nr:OmpA family protein [Bacteroidia bacterium]